MLTEPTSRQAARQAQERMQAYLQDVLSGAVRPERWKAIALAWEADETFKAWMASCREFTVH